MSDAFRRRVRRLISGQSNLTKGRIAAARGRLIRIRQAVPMCTPSNICFVRPTQTACRSVQPFLHSSRQTVQSLYFTMCRLIFPQNCPFPWVSGLCLIHGSLAPLCQVHSPNDISIGSAVFTSLTSATDRQTDRPTDQPTDRPRYSVCNNRPQRT